MFNAAVAKWRDELYVDLKNYLDRKDALMQLGISEDALEPIVP
jgi:hypothetical protein